LSHSPWWSRSSNGFAGTVTASDQISQTDFDTLLDAIAALGIPVRPIN
jgi:hypothetical protein